MVTKKYAKTTLKEFLEKVIVTNDGCWVYPTGTNIVSYHGVPTYVINAIFNEYGKEYKGKMIRTCGNKRCYNPDHLLSLNDEDKFWMNVDKGLGENSCWEWKPMRKSKSYGWINVNKVSIQTHRYSWIIHNGPIPDGMVVCHKCDNPPCVNPNHLFIGTIQDNVDDRERKGRNKMPHSKGEDHGHHKLTEEQVIEIRRLYFSGEMKSYKRLGNIYGLCFSAIRNIIKGKTWGWLK